MLAGDTGFWLLELAGPDFLRVYVAFFALAILASLLLARWLVPSGRAGRLEDADEVAVASGGHARLAETALARLVEEGAVASLPQGRFAVVGAVPPAAGRVDRAVLAAGPDLDWATARDAVAIEWSRIGARLERAGLVIAPATRQTLRWCQTAPLLLLLALGLAKLAVGIARDKPVALLAVLLVVTLFAIWCRYAVVRHTTRGGLAALERARERAQRLKRAPAAGETAMAVALFGTAVLVGTEFAVLHQARSSGGGGDSSGGCGGGGGGGGGGCGGCGGS